MSRERHQLDRLLRPRSVAIVGASEGSAITDPIVDFMAESDVELFLVNPRKPTVYGRPSYPSLSAIGKPIDAVCAVIRADLTIDLVKEALETGAGGVAAIAGGFRESGPAGALLEQQLVEAADGKIPIIGPNCLGFTDFRRGVDLGGMSGVWTKRLPGGSIALVGHSGGVLSYVTVAGAERGIGFSHVISTGNEANLDVADCIEFLARSPETRAICIVIESISRPEAFFAAVESARLAKKPVIALKLARNARAREISKSHTGRLVGDSWAYDAAFRQHGISIARDVVELAEMCVCFDQLPPERWTPIRGLGVMSVSGGSASMASDLLADFKLNLPELTTIQNSVRELLPHAGVINPVDMTGFVLTQPDLARRLINLYAESDELDALCLLWFTNDVAIKTIEPFLHTFVDAARRNGKIALLGSVADEQLGERARQLIADGVVVTRGIVGASRALLAMADFMSAQQRLPSRRNPPQHRALPRPDAKDIVESDAGSMLKFGAAMALLRSAGIPIAPYSIVACDQESNETSLGNGPFVVKLADVPHRTEIDGVRLNVSSQKVNETIQDLRRLAHARNLPATVVIQPYLSLHGEAFVGIRGESDLGPMVACGLGGIFVEILKRVAGLVVPFSRDDALHALHELNETGIFEGLRGSAPWSREALADIVFSAGQLASGCNEWLLDLDINPLGVSDQGFVALDCLCLVKPVQG